MKYIELTRSYAAVVDDKDYDLVSEYSWSVHINGKRVVGASASVPDDKGLHRQKRLSMHRLIMGDVTPTQVVDHINGDTLDNRRSNLRVCTQAQNSRNYHGRRGGTSGYKGVCKRTEPNLTHPWRAAIRFNYKLIGLGHYATEEAAAVAYNAAAKKYFGEFAQLNEVAA